ncbi:MAG: ABC transporter permease subunit [Verrucomicrobiota bacterium]|nr:ABC transporter permease subunit [Verrucomicrobiota bacterium]
MPLTVYALSHADATHPGLTAVVTAPTFLRTVGVAVAVALAVCVIGVILASGSAYALSRLRLGGMSFLFSRLIVSLLLPAIVVATASFAIMVELRATALFVAVTLSYVCTLFPIAVWQLRNYYDAIPCSIEEAARLEGASAFRNFYRLVLPVAAPALRLVALFSFLGAWNECFLVAFLLHHSNATNVSHFGQDWIAATVLLAVPIILSGLILLRGTLARPESSPVR